MDSPTMELITKAGFVVIFKRSKMYKAKTKRLHICIIQIRNSVLIFTRH